MNNYIGNVYNEKLSEHDEITVQATLCGINVGACGGNTGSCGIFAGGCGANSKGCWIDGGFS